MPGTTLDTENIHPLSPKKIAFIKFYSFPIINKKKYTLTYTLVPV